MYEFYTHTMNILFLMLLNIDRGIDLNDEKGLRILFK